MMAKMAAEKATQPELRELARKIVATQELEIELMTNWLRDWYGMQPLAGHMMSREMMRNMHMPMMRDLMPDMEVRMQALEAQRRSAFDVVFMSSMIDHHAMAVMMALPVLIAGHHQA